MRRRKEAKSSSFKRWSRPLHRYAVDALAWAIAIPSAAVLRFEFDLGQIDWIAVFWLVLVAVAAQGVLGIASGTYRRRWRYGSFDELLGLAWTVLMVGSLTSVVVWMLPTPPIPRSVPMLATTITVSATVAARAMRRLYLLKKRRPEEAEPLVVIGAGQAGYEIVRTLLNTPDAPYRPVALLDDDPLKVSMRIQGVRVEGVVEDLQRVAAKSGATCALLAIPSAEIELVRLVDQMARQGGLELLVLPPVRDMFTAPTVADIRPVNEADLLGRSAAEIDTAAVAHYITGRRVLVTGAGGSIGSELCRQLARFEPAALMMLDRDESGLHGVQLSIEGRALLDSPNLVLADIRDANRLEEVFAQHRPEVVFHAAALKHLTLLEQSPDEAWKTNVIGTQNVLAAAASVGVTHFVNISTDKAADPTSVLGSSKRITERLTAAMADRADGSFVSVRFGNVLGSRGSVLTIFRAQSEAGGPLTVTHPDVTRFFMTVQEAVRLTIYAGAIGDSGDVMVLDMGKPVRIADVATRFAKLHRPELEIVYTGLRPGEKLHEDLFGADEFDVRPKHPLISHVPVPPLQYDAVVSLGAGRRNAAMLAAIATEGLVEEVA